MTTRVVAGLRRFVPAPVKYVIRRIRRYARLMATPLNIYHCCLPRTGSQWMAGILSDARVYEYSALTVHAYQKALPGGVDQRNFTQRVFTAPFPERTILSPLYIDFENYAAIPKPKRYRAFFVMRDPRDIVVSRYFSARYSHAPIGRIPQRREVLKSMSMRDGILYCIDDLGRRGAYAALKSWADRAKQDRNALPLRFEALTGPDGFAVFKRLFAHCGIRMPDRLLADLLRDHSFERLSGRKPGEEDHMSHYRKGIPGDWKNYMDEVSIAPFKEATGDLVARLGYEQDPDW